MGFYIEISSINLQNQLLIGEVQKMGTHDKIFLGILMIIALAGSVNAFSCGDSVIFTYRGSQVTYGSVENPTTGECWLDRNLGASQMATAYDDYLAYGDLFQWGRLDDGHQTIVWASSTSYDGTEQTRETSTNSPGDVPGHDDFILESVYPYDWRAPQNDNLWQGVDGINNPCPIGWRLPTYAEWEAERVSWTDGNDRVGAFGSPLKLTVAGYRYDIDGAVNGAGSPGHYWSSTTSSEKARYLYFVGVGGNAYVGSYNRARGLSVRCLYDEPPSTPTTSNFTSTETTNFSEVADITNVTSMTLAVTGKGKIKFSSTHSINAEAQDYDTNIVIEDEFISVNTAALDESFNSSATITLEGITCPVETITYQEGTFTSKQDIISGGSNCELDGVCSNIQCSDSTLTFDVLHFTGFAAGADANLTIQAQAGVFYPLEPIEFTAEYVNSTDGTPISGECNITFDDDTEYTMDFNSPIYNYTKAFVTAGTHEYNVTCSSTNFVTLEANDTKLVSSVDIPEFSVLTLGLGLIAVLIGLFVIRKKSY